MLLEDAGEIARGLHFLKAQLGKAEYLVDHHLGHLAARLHPGHGLGLEALETRLLPRQQGGGEEEEEE